MFQFGTDDDEQPEGLAAALFGAKQNSMPDFGLAATLSQTPNSSMVFPAAGGPTQDANDQAGSNTPDAGNSEAAPADDTGAEQWGKMLAQLYEAGKFKSGYLSKIFGSVDYANLSAESANTTMTLGLADIRHYEQTGGGHLLFPFGTTVRWDLVDWSKYGAEDYSDEAPEVVMRRFLTSAMSSGD